MEAINDLTWMRQLARFPAERFELRGFNIALFEIPNTPEHHAERYRYRLLAFDPALGKPVLAVNLESDILGDFCLSLQTADEHRIVSRYDDLPSLAYFRGLAVSEAEVRLPAD